MILRPAETVRWKAGRRVFGGTRAACGSLTRKIESRRCRDPYCNPLYEGDDAAVGAAAVLATLSPSFPTLPLLLFPAMNLLHAETAREQ